MPDQDTDTRPRLVIEVWEDVTDAHATRQHLTIDLRLPDGVSVTDAQGLAVSLAGQAIGRGLDIAARVPLVTHGSGAVGGPAVSHAGSANGPSEAHSRGGPGRAAPGTGPGGGGKS